MVSDCILELCQVAPRIGWSFPLRALQLNLRLSLEKTIRDVVTIQYAIMAVDMAMNRYLR